MQVEHVDQFEARSSELRASVQRIVDAADGLRDLIEEAKLSVARCYRTSALLRRSEDPNMMGPLNSVSAAASQQLSVGSGLHDLDVALAKFEDHARELRILHPQVVQALREKLAIPAAVPVQEPG